MGSKKLWAVSIPEEPDSEEILYPVPSKEIGEQLVSRLRDEARRNFKHVGEAIAEAVTLGSWSGTAEEHAQYMLVHGNWWDYTTFLEGV